NPKAPTRRRYDGVAALVIEMCNEAPKTVEQLVAVAAHPGTSQAEIEPILADLTSRRVLYQERGRYFTLAIPEHPYL
ncbi:MAG TPA: RiPP maturation radical SAM protein 1, partial [Nitrospira sp.]|nr:RiPP maturation radical SAM protein 1 [Nitrospira sp.]